MSTIINTIMPRINSKTLLTKYILSQLGSPTINIEVTSKQISEIIDMTVQKFTEYAYGELEDTVIVQIDGAKEYPMPDTMTNVIKITTGSANSFSNYGDGYVPDMWSDQFFSSGLTGGTIQGVISISSTTAILDKYVGKEINHSFNHLSKNLRVLENFKGNALIHFNYEYIANEQNDFVYNHEWIKRYAMAKTKFLWGSVTGKFSQTLIGGASINYSDMKSEAIDEIDKLDEELLSKYADPCPIMIG